MRKLISTRLAAIFFASVLVALPAHAAKKKKATQPSNTRSVEIDVPELRQTLPAEEEEAAGLPNRMAVLISSFTPKAIEIPSRVRATDFEMRGLPQVSVAYQTFVAGTRAGDFYAQAGAGYQSFERHGFVSLSNVQFASNQQLYMIPMKAGVVFEPRLLRTELFRSLVGLSALPTFAMTEESALSEDQSFFATGYELSLGLAADLARLFGSKSEEQGMSLGLNLAHSFGGSGELDFNRLSVQAGVLWPFN